MPHAGLPSPFWLALSVALVLSTCLPPRASAQTVSDPTGSPPERPSLTQQIESLKSKAQTLVARLIERNSQVTELTNSLAQARQKSDDSAASSETLAQQLEAAKAERDSLRTDLQATLHSLDQLQETQKRSESAFQDYRVEMQRQVRDVGHERDTWKVIAIVTIVMAAGLGIYAAVK